MQLLVLTFHRVWHVKLPFLLPQVSLSGGFPGDEARPPAGSQRVDSCLWKHTSLSLAQGVQLIPYLFLIASITLITR